MSMCINVHINYFAANIRIWAEIGYGAFNGQAALMSGYPLGCCHGVVVIFIYNENNVNNDNNDIKIKPCPLNLQLSFKLILNTDKSSYLCFMAKRKKKLYVVWVGKTPGVYDNWKDCQSQISGFPNAKYKSFNSEDEAMEAYKSTYDEFYQKGTKKKSKAHFEDFLNEIEANSFCVDAACSGNPGDMEYRGVTLEGEEIFHKGPFEYGTNNIGEFLALVHALAYFNKTGEKATIYSDSRTAMSWVRNKKVKTKLKRNAKNDVIFVLIDRAQKWLENNSWDHKILKWDTERWGEIPADFGRK